MGRYLTKICDQVVALLSTDHTASIVWNDIHGEPESNTGSMDIYAGDSERLFTFEVAKTIEPERAVSRPGFQVTLTFNLYFLFDLLTSYRSIQTSLSLTRRLITARLTLPSSVLGSCLGRLCKAL